ncbi:hypothetical protein FG379_000269 [Cryptosporidium bovis]|uniref:uncharacterized protein n=1 Tax=Cryptosporidium bovis TaxID=310047 RepID=UPI00351A9943|nr:hypothetical protein FG379_000269 [Cryptosporidium bovis]
MFTRYNLKIVESHVLYNNVGIKHNIKNCFSNISGGKYALDIGGTLIKLVYTINSKEQIMLREEETSSYKYCNYMNISENNNNDEIFPSSILFCLIPINDVDIIEQIENVFGFLIERGLYVINDTVSMTGGGSVKYKALIENKYKIYISYFEEVSGIVMGYFKLFEHEKNNRYFNYLINYEKNEISLKNNAIFSHSLLLPTLIVSVGSGISIIKVENKDKFERIGGTRFGGGTIYGLGKLLGINNYKELINVYKQTNNPNDNSFEDSSKYCYFKEILFANLNNNSLKFKEKAVNDIINLMFTDLSYLLCLLLLRHKIRNIVFCGNNVSSNYDIIVKSIKKYSSFLIKDDVSIFFHHLDGFFGAIGACFS